jgi:uncharacterized protein
MIIDSHAHIDEAIDLGWIDPPEIHLPLMDKAGIDMAVVKTYRDAIQPDDPSTMYINNAIARYPEKLVGYVRLNPQVPNAIEIVDQALGQYKFMGIKFHPVSYVGFPFGDATMRIARHAIRYHAPVLFHTGDEAMALPQEVAEVAQKCPETVIVMRFFLGQGTLSAFPPEFAPQPRRA